jgi:hypothetical protein
MNFTTLEEFKDNFNKALELIENKQALIKNEIQEIEGFINNDSLTSNQYDYLRSQFIESRTEKNIFRIILPKNSKEDFLIAYKEFKINGKVSVSKYPHEMDELFTERKLVYKQAEELAKYSDWLTNLLNNKPELNEKKKPFLYLNQKLIALQYLGLDMRKFDDTKSARILHHIIGMDESNIKKALPHIYFNAPKNKVRTKENLERLLLLFENEQFAEIKREIEKDLDYFKK